MTRARVARLLGRVLAAAAVAITAGLALVWALPAVQDRTFYRHSPGLLRHRKCRPECMAAPPHAPCGGAPA